MFSFKEKNFFKFFFFNFNDPTPFHSWSVHSPMVSHKLKSQPNSDSKHRETARNERPRCEGLRNDDGSASAGLLG